MLPTIEKVETKLRGGRGGVGILLYKLFLRIDANIMVIYTNREQSQGYHNA